MRTSSYYIPPAPAETLSRLDGLVETLCHITSQPKKILFQREPRSINKFILQSAFIYIARNKYLIPTKQIELYLELNYTMVHKRHQLITRHYYRDEKGAKIPFIQSFTLKLIRHFEQFEDLPPLTIPTLSLPDGFEIEMKTKAVTYTVEAFGTPRYKTKHGFIDSKGQIILRPPE